METPYMILETEVDSKAVICNAPGVSLVEASNKSTNRSALLRRIVIRVDSNDHATVQLPTYKVKIAKLFKQQIPEY